MTPPETRARVRCPRCHELVIDLDMREWFAADRTPDDFTDAVARLLRAHTDSCKPRPPAYTPKMRAGRLAHRIGVWVPAGIFAGWGNFVLAGGDFDGLIGISAGLCILFGGLSARRTYAAGYNRGHFAATHHQPFLDSRWLHPGDGINDPADKPHHHLADDAADDERDRPPTEPPTEEKQ